MRPTVALLAAALLLALPAAAQTESPSPAPEATPAKPDKAEVTTGAMKLKVNGILWPFYVYNLTGGAEDVSSFGIGRAYVTLEPAVTETVDGRLTLDITTQKAGKDSTGAAVETNTTGSLLFRLKFGLLAWHPAEWADVILGMAPTPWTTYEESIWGYRILEPTAVDQFYGISSSDLGFGVKLRALDNRLELHSALQNGGGFSHTVEENKYKELATRASFQVLPAEGGGLKVGAYYGYALTAQDADKVRGVGMVSWQSPMLTAAGGYIYSQDGDGAGTHVVGGGPFAFGHVNLPLALPGTKGSRLLARVDLADPDVDSEDDAATRLVAGASILISSRSQVIFDYQQLSYEASGVDPSRAAFVHWEAKF